MCRIDASFDDISSLDEKFDPVERFLQALEEYKAEGEFRKLLNKHLSKHWKSIFKTESALENALSDAKQFDSEPEKSISILLSQKTALTNNVHRHFGMYKGSINDSALIGLLNDIAQTYYQDSPYGLFINGMNKVQGDYFLFASWLYGNKFCFSKGFFDDTSLNSESKTERSDILWRCFYSIAPTLDSQRYPLDENSLLKELTSIASSCFASGPLTKHSLEIMRGLDFLRTWIKFDSQSGRNSYDWYGFIYDARSPWDSIKGLIRNNNIECDDTSRLLISWFESIERELQKLLYVNADLSLIQGDGIDYWADGLDNYLNQVCKDLNFDVSDVDEPFDGRNNELSKLCSELGSLQVSTWINHSINKDFQSLLSRKDQSSSCTLTNSGDKWIQEEFFGIWKAKFLEKLNELDIENQYYILCCSAPYVGRSFSSDFTWCNELFSNLVEQDNFPKNLIASWTVGAIYKKLNREKVAHYIDKSIGILRGELSKTESKEELERYHLQLKLLLSKLDNSSQKKALRHRLMLMRSSKEPFSNESISKIGNLFDRDESFNKWYYSLNQLSNTYLANQSNGNREVTLDNFEQLQINFFLNFSQELAGFCLSRLRLRKGEKAEGGKYSDGQVIEQSPIWRQGYLKALMELGFDLNGKVHKTVNFTNKSDPNESVRSIAGECYKAVRRNRKSNSSIQGIKRGIVAAEWWLLISQRKELDLEIKPDEALKTRRNLMRNP